jgi:RNA polymerase sigma-70 factor, ECF subfamily
MGQAARKLRVSPPEQVGDRELVQRTQDGDQDAYRVLVERYQGRIFAVAYGILHNREDAREVTQEAFIKAFRNLSGFRRDASFYTWLYRIAINLGIDFRRKAYRNRETGNLDEGRLGPDVVSPITPRPVGNPGQTLERKELREKIRSAIDQLPDDQKTVIILREVEGLSYKEIADTMNCAEGTVMSRLFYARKKLQVLLADARAENRS